MKNPASKTRPVTQPYASWTDARSGWKYKLLKSWQGDNSKPYARWFVDVEGFGHDRGDTYVAEMYPGLMAADEIVFDTSLWEDRFVFLRWVQGW